MLRIHLEHLAERRGGRVELALPHLEQADLLVAQVFELPLLRERRRDAGVASRDRARELRFGLVEHVLEPVGARQLQANLGAPGSMRAPWLRIASPSSIRPESR